MQPRPRSWSNTKPKPGSPNGCKKLGFGTIVGSGDTTVNQFHVLESGSANAQPLGRITAAPATVPEPDTIALFGIGLLGMGILDARRRRA